MKITSVDIMMLEAEAPEKMCIRDRIMIGGVMLLIPGIAMTNAIRDMLIGDIASGLLRLMNSVLVAVAIACGFAFSIVALGGVLWQFN